MLGISAPQTRDYREAWCCLELARTRQIARVYPVELYLTFPICLVSTKHSTTNCVKVRFRLNVSCDHTEIGASGISYEALTVLGLFVVALTVPASLDDSSLRCTPQPLCISTASGDGELAARREETFNRSCRRQELGCSGLAKFWQFTACGAASNTSHRRCYLANTL